MKTISRKESKSSVGQWGQAFLLVLPRKKMFSKSFRDADYLFLSFK